MTIGGVRHDAGVERAGDVTRDPRPDAAAPHSGRRRSDALLQIQTVLQGRPRQIRLCLLVHSNLIHF